MSGIVGFAIFWGIGPTRTIHREEASSREIWFLLHRGIESPLLVGERSRGKRSPIVGDSGEVNDEGELAAQSLHAIFAILHLKSTIWWQFGSLHRKDGSLTSN